MRRISMPLDLDRALPPWREHTVSEVRFAVRLHQMIWMTPQLRLKASMSTLQEMFDAEGVISRYGRVEHIVVGSGAFWWSDRDELLYSRYIQEIAGPKVARTAIPSWMKQRALDDALASCGDGQTFHACYYCTADVGSSPHFDHLLPISRGGINHPNNLCVSCPSCNLSKGAKTDTQFGRRPLTPIYGRSVNG